MWGNLLRTVGGGITSAGKAVNNALGTHIELAPGGLGAAITHAAGTSQPLNQPYTTPSFSNYTGTLSNGTYSPPSSSSSVGTGGTSYGGTTGSSTPQLATPNFSNPNPSTGDQLSLLQQAYQNAANDIQNQGGLLDNSYSTAKGDIQNAIDSASKQADTQSQGINQGFGDLLRQTNQNYQDLQNQQRGTFGALGTLDSSFYNDAQNKAQQGLLDNVSRQDVEKQKELTGVQNTLTDYENQAHSQLANLANQYQAGKNAIASALANNDLGSADAIQNALAQIRANAQQIQNSMIGFANQQALYGMNGSNYGQTMSAINSFNPASYIQNMQGILKGIQGQTSNLATQVPSFGTNLAAFLGSQPKKDQFGNTIQ